MDRMDRSRRIELKIRQLSELRCSIEKDGTIVIVEEEWFC
jgi:hypothetical protein